MIERSIIGSGVDIGDNTRVDRGSLIGDDVVIGHDVHLKAFSRLSRKREHKPEGGEDEDEDVDSEEEEVEASEDFSLSDIFFSDASIDVFY